jgi:hypothetical protein
VRFRHLILVCWAFRTSNPLGEMRLILLFIAIVIVTSAAGCDRTHQPPGPQLKLAVDSVQVTLRAGIDTLFRQEIAVDNAGGGWLGETRVERAQNDPREIHGWLFGTVEGAYPGPVWVQFEGDPRELSPGRYRMKAMVRSQFGSPDSAALYLEIEVVPE